MGDSFVIAIDFGTAYSGYAFSLTSKETQDDVFLNRWGKELGLETPKTPTCILFNEKEEFLKFGYEAKTTYMKMRGEEATNHYFFEAFKMALYGTKLNKDVTITAANGKSMNALKVFTSALSYLKENALTTISANTAGMKLIASDFTWVLTVPAIWDPSAKQFMREAATRAGIVTKGTEDKLVIALEPEAASVWCKKLPAEGFVTQNHNKDSLEQTPGTQYIVVDCGGGTIDITVHEVLDGGALKELHKASGNNMGGQTVDKKFKEFLRKIFCDGVWDEYETKFPSEVQKMMYDFAVLKQEDEDVQITCTFNLGEIAQRKKDMGKFFETVQGASWHGGSIKITKEKMKSFFNESLNGISKSLREILKKALNIQFILLVGGYAESKILRFHIKAEFGLQCKVLCPFRAQEAIVRGAVQFGRNPEVVASRKSAFTYGIATCQSFDKSKHKAEKKFTTGEDDFCNDIFMKLVEIDEGVDCNETKEHIFNPVEADQTEMNLSFYRTERKNAKYVDEWGVKNVASFVVNMPDTTQGMKRDVRLEIRFGSTEITATATDLVSGSTGSIKIDFLTKK
ncbi:heat shock 70 kDa protein 12A-like [Seriola lalandi dorsalis]|uniref:Heat shock 70 kDa protein 12A-like n=1 Tax=Seriola lalandi dorsalis TaxID=1841481 RepID=A0A3B4WJM3_SERLL|nr:heat shock 70 kDa protein 12A-like [Seriola lalandi dorsalis]XP_056245473.1 heat shock 70 kDa protein 12A-like [Seriola aureovittata]